MAAEEQYIPAAVRDRISPKARELIAKVHEFVHNECIPADAVVHAQIPGEPSKRWTTYPKILDELKKKARARGLWNLFLHKAYPEGPGLSNLEYAIMAEISGRSTCAPEAMNVSAPDTGNMEVIAKYGTAKQKAQWLTPLLNGEIRSTFAMTERFIASSDATNIRTSIVADGNDYIINGIKWWASGAGDPRCKILIVMGKSDPHNPDKYKQHSVVLVPKDQPGVHLIRPLRVLGFDDAPHGHFEIHFRNCRVPKENIVLGEGRGFEIIQGRLGPGRIHHCMRQIGVAERALDLMVVRATNPDKRTFGKQLADHGGVVLEIAKARMEIEAGRLLVLNAADEIDRTDAKGALQNIAIAKVYVPRLTQSIVDAAIQMHGAEGMCQDTPLANLFAHARTLRIADGPDESHLFQMGRNELKRASSLQASVAEYKRKEETLLKQHDVRAHL